MSIAARNVVWQAKVLSPTEKLVALRIAEVVDDRAEFWGSIRNLAEACGLNAGTVRRVIARAKKVGWLAVVRSSAGRFTARYRLVLSALSTGPVDEPETDDSTRAHSAATRAQDAPTRAQRAPIRKRKEKEKKTHTSGALASVIANTFTEHRPTSPAPPVTQADQRAIERHALTAPNPTAALDRVPSVLSWALSDPFWRRIVVDGATFAKHFPRLCASATDGTQAKPERPTIVNRRESCSECHGTSMILDDRGEAHRCSCALIAA